VPTVRHGQGTTAWTARLETEVAGMTALTPSEPYGTPAHARHAKRRDCPPHPSHAVVVRTWNHRDNGPGGQTVFLTNAPVDKPVHPFDADDDRSLSEHGGIQERQQPWRLKRPPQQTARAVRGHVMVTLRMCAWATAYRRPCAQEDTGGAPVGGQRWRRRLLEHPRNRVIVCAKGSYGIFPIAESSRRLGGHPQRWPSRHRDTAAHLGHIQDHRTGLRLYPNFRINMRKVDFVQF
jgi:hypothetical protein